MRIFKDIFSGDELCSDTYKLKLVDGVIYEITCKLVTETTDIGDDMIGGNPSEEAGGEGAEASSVSGVNVVLAHRLIETGFKKKDYKKYIKEYMGSVMEKLEGEELATFKANMNKHIKKIVEEFDEYQFFMGESANDKGMMIPLRYEGETPMMYIFKHGVEEEKC